MQRTYRKLNECIVPDPQLRAKVMERTAPKRAIRLSTLATAATLLVILVAIPMAVFAEEYVPMVREFLALVLKEETVDGVVTYQEGVDSEGNHWAAFEAPLEKMPDWLTVDGDRVLFTANGESLDITEAISEDTPFIYQYTDSRNITHYMAVGRCGDELGWMKRRRDGLTAAEGIYAGWIVNGDYFHGYWNNDTDSPYGWYMKAFEELGIPWMNPHKEYYDYDPETWGN